MLRACRGDVARPAKARLCLHLEVRISRAALSVCLVACFLQWCWGPSTADCLLGVNDQKRIHRSTSYFQVLCPMLSLRDTGHFECSIVR